MQNLIKPEETLEDLQLKNLKIIQKKQGFRFGIDAVLLANYTNIHNNKDTVVDFGTGTGIIPMIIAGKSSPKHIYAFEIQEEMADMAKRTVQYNNMQDKITIYNENILEAVKILGKSSVEVITSNPPYMPQEKLNAQNQNQSISRNEISITLEQILNTASQILKPTGRLYMVYRPSRLGELFYHAVKYKLEPKIMTMVHPKLGKAPNMVLIKFIKLGKSELRIKPPLYVHKDDNSYTKEIIQIYSKESLTKEANY